MANSTRSAEYLAIIKQRRGDLHQYLAKALGDHTNFVWEIGCGHGHFLTAFAQAYPEKLCIGIDLATERIERATRKRDRSKLGNLHFVQAEARLFVESLPDSATFADVFVLFPDPWPKSRHHKHRLLQSDFLKSISSRAGQGARLLFRTDFQPYFDDVNETIRQGAHWKLVNESWPFEHETVFQSRAAHYHSLVARPIAGGSISPPHQP